METVRIFNKYTNESLIVNLNRPQLKGLLYLFKLGKDFDYEKSEPISNEKETGKTLWDKFFKNYFQNKDLVIQRLEGNLN